MRMIIKPTGIFFIFFFMNQCMLHYNRVKHQNEIAFKVSQASNDIVTTEKTIPAYFSFDNKKSRHSLYLVGEENKNIVYFNELKHVFENSTLFKENYQSNLVINYNTEYKRNQGSFSAFLFLITLGIFPAMEDVERKSNFYLFDRKKNKIINRYAYIAKSNVYMSWFSLFPGSFFSLFSEKFKLENYVTPKEHSAKIIMQQFENDFQKNLSNKVFRKKIQKTAYVKSPKIMILPILRQAEIKNLDEKILNIQNIFEEKLQEYHFSVIPNMKTDASIQLLVNSEEGFSSQSLFKFAKSADIDFIISPKVESIEQHKLNKIFQMKINISLINVKTGQYIRSKIITVHSKYFDLLFELAGETLAKSIFLYSRNFPK